MSKNKFTVDYTMRVQVEAHDREHAARLLEAFQRSIGVASGDIAVDDVWVDEWCDTCGGPLFRDQPYNLDEDGVAWHVEGDERCKPRAEG